MITFIIPFAHPTVFKDYAVAAQNLELTLQTLSSQSSSKFNVVVVCNEIPSHKKFRNIHYHLVDFLPVNINNKYISKENKAADRVRLDKGTRLLSGYMYASSRFDSDYIFFADADDWFHKDLVLEMLSSTKEDIKYVNKSFLVNRKHLKFKVVYGMSRYCGSTVAYKTDAINRIMGNLTAIDMHSSNEKIWESVDVHLLKKLFGSHTYWLEFAEKYYLNYGEIDLMALCYVVANGSNDSGSESGNDGCSLNADLISNFSLGKHVDNNREEQSILCKFKHVIASKKSEITWNRSLKKNKMIY